MKNALGTASGNASGKDTERSKKEADRSLTGTEQKLCKGRKILKHIAAFCFFFENDFVLHSAGQPVPAYMTWTSFVTGGSSVLLNPSLKKSSVLQDGRFFCDRRCVCGPALFLCSVKSIPVACDDPAVCDPRCASGGLFPASLHL
ncbi:hypothetical protein [Undibacterium squillarum]|uniref:hypothetical protein n=1 Tax=Undibacterium squillarum TaxID=1131567 RepID=UPI0016726E3D|nr:hypothetical protein [Undibacterium squillarum]